MNAIIDISLRIPEGDMHQSRLQPSRRLMLGLPFAALASSKIDAQPRLSLGQVALSRGLLFGASSSWEIVNDAEYAALFRREIRLLVTDKALKFDYIRPRENVWNFDEADALHDFAIANGIPLRGHTLIWNDYPPPWLKGKSKAELTGIFDAHIERVGSRFAGKLQSWDVVNEPFWPGHGNSGGFRSGPWYEAMGEAYVERAFERLAQVDRQSLFVLNEAQTERHDETGLRIRHGLLRLIDRLQDRGVKLDAIGLQAHIKPQYPFEIGAFLRFIEEIAKRKLAIYLTEFDIDDMSLSEDPRRRDAEVAQWTTRFLGPVLQNRAVKAVICWHLSDKYSWYREPELVAYRKRNNPARPLPFDDTFREKPMAEAMRAAFLSAPMR
jgi:endo-1,4-beta-xylanase